MERYSMWTTIEENTGQLLRFSGSTASIEFLNYRSGNWETIHYDLKHFAAALKQNPITLFENGMVTIHYTSKNASLGAGIDTHPSGSWYNLRVE